MVTGSGQGAVMGRIAGQRPIGRRRAQRVQEGIEGLTDREGGQASKGSKPSVVSVSQSAAEREGRNLKRASRSGSGNGKRVRSPTCGQGRLGDAL